MRVLLSDTSVLLNLLAGGCLAEVSQAIGLQFVICTAVRQETQTLRDPHTGEMLPIDLAPLIDAGLLQVVGVEGDEEEARYVAESAEVDDGEAMSVAIATCRALDLAIDDRRAKNHVSRTYPKLRIWDTPEILKTWYETGGVEQKRIQDALLSIETRARFAPGKAHVLAAWWRDIRDCS